MLSLYPPNRSGSREAPGAPPRSTGVSVSPAGVCSFSASPSQSRSIVRCPSSACAMTITPVTNGDRGMRRGEPVARLEVDERDGCGDEARRVDPPVSRSPSAGQLGALLDDAEAPARPHVLAAGPERERLERAAEAEADVGVPVRAVGADSQDEMRSRPRSRPAGADADAREEQVDLRAERLERRLQEQVLLEAVAAAALGDELALEVLGGERHRDPAVGIEVLERDRGDCARCTSATLGRPRRPIRARYASRSTIAGTLIPASGPGHPSPPAKRSCGTGRSGLTARSRRQSRPPSGPSSPALVHDPHSRMARTPRSPPSRLSADQAGSRSPLATTRVS